MPLLEDIIVRIVELRSQNRNSETIAKELGITREEVELYEDSLSNILKNRLQTSEKIKALYEAGARTARELAEKTGLTRVTICKYARKLELPLSKKLGLPLNRKLISKKKEHPELENLVRQGLTLKKIGSHLGFTRERARQIRNREGLYELHQERRKLESVESRREHLKELLTCIAERMSQVATQEGWAYEKAVEYTRNHSPRKHPFKQYFESLVFLFKRYENAQQHGEKLSLKELSEGTIWESNKFPDPFIGRILTLSGLETMHWKRHITPQHKKEAIKRAVTLTLSDKDAGYFLGLHDFVVSANWNIWHLKDKRPKDNKLLKKRDGNRFITYRLASEVYEGLDLCGLNRDEIAEIVGISGKSIDYLIENRRYIEPKIVQDLKVIYGDETIDKPYKRKF